MSELYPEEITIYLLFMILRTQIEQLYRRYKPPLRVAKPPDFIYEPRKETDINE